MKMFASLHTEMPGAQSHKEVHYAGYKRVEIDYDAQFGQQTVTLLFPEIQESIDGVRITHLCIGPNQEGAGHAHQVVELCPHIPIMAGFPPRVIVANIPEPLPDTIHPLASALWNQINEAKILAEDLDPTVFEALNDELQRVGVPILKITRSGAAKMSVKFSQMRSLNLNAAA